jgi:hypothetical protein
MAVVAGRRQPASGTDREGTLASRPLVRVLVAALVLGGCAQSQRHETEPTPVGLPWRAEGLPAVGQIRSLAAAGGAVVAVVGTDGPAPDSRLLIRDQGAWRTIDTVARSYYGGRGSFVSVAGSRSGPTDLAALRGASGGAHGNPRYTAWSGDVRRMAEVPATFETFGGPSALGPVDVAVGSAGPLLVGGWVADGLASPAFWSPAAGTWRRVVGGPGMTSTSSRLLSLTSVRARQDGYLVTGVATVLGQGTVRFRPMVWTGRPGRWQAVALPAGAGDVRADAAECFGRRCLVLGSDRDGVLSWQVGGPAAPSTPGRPIDRPLAEHGLLVGAAGPELQVIAAQTVDGQRIVVGRADRWRAVRPPSGELVGLVMTADALLVAARVGEVCSLWSVPTRDLMRVAAGP